MIASAAIKSLVEHVMEMLSRWWKGVFDRFTKKRYLQLERCEIESQTVKNPIKISSVKSCVKGRKIMPFFDVHLLLLSACLFASFVQDSLTNLIGLKSLYLFGLITFGTSMLITVLFPSVIVLNVCAAFSGVGSAVATTIPGTLVNFVLHLPKNDMSGNEMRM